MPLLDSLVVLILGMSSPQLEWTPFAEVVYTQVQDSTVKRDMILRMGFRDQDDVDLVNALDTTGITIHLLRYDYKWSDSLYQKMSEQEAPNAE